MFDNIELGFGLWWRNEDVLETSPKFRVLIVIKIHIVLQNQYINIIGVPNPYQRNKYIMISTSWPVDTF